MVDVESQRADGLALEVGDLRDVRARRHAVGAILRAGRICFVSTPFAFQTSQVSTVVAAHWMSPEAIEVAALLRDLLDRGVDAVFLKMPACSARVSGAKPVQPLMPIC